MAEKKSVSCAIVYHSGFGHTKVLAEHVFKGAALVQNVEAVFMEAAWAKDNVDALTAYDAMIFGCPTYMGSGSSVFKAFMEATTGVWAQRAWKDKIAAGFTNSISMSGDKCITLVQLAVFCGQHGMIWVPSTDMNNTGRGSPKIPAGDPGSVNRLGSWLGLMGQSDDKSTMPAEGDLVTAEHFGAHVAEVTLRWHGLKNV